MFVSVHEFPHVQIHFFLKKKNVNQDLDMI